MQEDNIILDFSMQGFENGMPRMYCKIFPTITGRIYKEPLKVLEIRKVDRMYAENTIARAEQSRAEQSRAEQSSLMYVA